MPSSDEAANELRNRNISQSAGMESLPARVGMEDEEGGYDYIDEGADDVYDEAYDEAYEEPPVG